MSPTQSSSDNEDPLLRPCPIDPDSDDFLYMLGVTDLEEQSDFYYQTMKIEASFPKETKNVAKAVSEWEANSDTSLFSAQSQLDHADSGKKGIKILPKTKKYKKAKKSCKKSSPQLKNREESSNMQSPEISIKDSEKMTKTYMDHDSDSQKLKIKKKKSIKKNQILNSNKETKSLKIQESEGQKSKKEGRKIYKFEELLKGLNGNEILEKAVLQKRRKKVKKTRKNLMKVQKEQKMEPQVVDFESGTEFYPSQSNEIQRKEQRRKVRKSLTEQILQELAERFREYKRDVELGNPRQNLKKIGADLDIGYSTMLHKYREFKRTGSVRRGMLIEYKDYKRAYKKSLKMKGYILEGLKEGEMTGREMAEWVNDRYGLRVSVSVVRRHLAEIRQLQMEKDDEGRNN